MSEVNRKETSKKLAEEIPLEQRKKGWGFPRNSRKAHYFIGIMSLCNKWMYFGSVEDSNDNSPDNCVLCRRKLEKIREKEKKNGD